MSTLITQKELLKIQQKCVNIRLQNLKELKKKVSIKQMIRKLSQEKLSQSQSDIDAAIKLCELELRAICLSRTYLRNWQRSKIEPNLRHLSKYENRTIISYMLYYCHGINNVNTHLKFSILNWLGLKESDVLWV